MYSVYYTGKYYFNVILMYTLTRVSQEHLNGTDDDHSALDVPNTEMPYLRTGLGTHREQIDVAITLPFLQIQYG